MDPSSRLVNPSAEIIRETNARILHAQKGADMSPDQSDPTLTYT